ncbi:hypothetical protein TPHA_0O01720 [Tetrapisispora phaffii CBS 4417]|uniref:RRM domain-containing protein n=1 Tax=Tetrapisispora phaffii (strain ATCC 24235 / CBS 4417 / NBRC 1672 / NRRL Y-8282 / UCD 70-5) TaxID=1071381 RepID=G8C1W1_TETPH|nr:hypothetical protein TPHA_0O01720 [Tetrapisispora phaffii CBS 4417]CCE66139.1 hypothetical protein TPHA_0O01720 [Tetrapisispora phaffii CBS 4417]
MPLIHETETLNDTSMMFQNENRGEYQTTNTSIPALGDLSPKHKQALGLHTVNGSNFKGQQSPLQLTSMLNSLTLSQDNQAVANMRNYNGPFVLILRNLPNEISLRECHAVFALAHNILSMELVKSENSEKDEPFLKVQIDSLVNAASYAMILSSKSDIFGPDCPMKSYVELFDQPTNQQVPYNELSQLNQSYRLGSDLNNLHNFKNIIPLAANSNIPSVFDGSTLPKKSRFSFSDNFSNESNLVNNTTENQHVSTGNSLNPQGSQSIPGHPQSFQELSATSSMQQGNVGKSILMMESDDINDAIWGSNGITFNNATTGSNSTVPMFEWNSGGSRKQNNLFGFSQQTNNMPNQSVQGSTAQLSNISSDGYLPANNNISSFGIPPSVNSSTQQMLSPLDSTLPANQHHPNISSQSSTFNINDKLSTDSQAAKNQSQTPHRMQPMRNTRNSQESIGLQKNSSTPSLSYSNLANTGAISQADLSLLAKVPPPANPADQNPPCNTLYVGNLPSDATEQELRQLFSVQQGFRRLSFRNKNNNGNGHGPICFVEFDDVSFATRALAELYGSQLPSATVSNKGGIRLSFSKNPLGVRGPNNRRNTSTPTLNGSSNSNNYSYIGNYGK